MPSPREISSVTDPHDLKTEISQAAEQRDMDTMLRAAEAAARRAAVDALRAQSRAQMAGIRRDLKDVYGKRRFVRLRIRDEMRAQLMNLNEDVERLRAQVRHTLESLKAQTADLATERRQRLAETYSGIAEETARRRSETRRMLDHFSQARLDRLQHMSVRLGAYRASLRDSTAAVLDAYRAERARQRATWRALRGRRTARTVPPAPITMADPLEAPVETLAPLAGNVPLKGDTAGKVAKGTTGGVTRAAT